MSQEIANDLVLLNIGVEYNSPYFIAEIIDKTCLSSILRIDQTR